MGEAPDGTANEWSELGSGIEGILQEKTLKKTRATLL